MDRVWDISPRPLTTVELRVIIWEVRDVPSMDYDDSSDIYVSVSLPSFD